MGEYTDQITILRRHREGLRQAWPQLAVARHILRDMSGVRGFGGFVHITRSLRCAAGLVALALVSCGGGSGSDNGPPPPATGGGGGTPAPTPAPTSSPTTTPAPPFGFFAPFAFDTAVGIEGTLFTYQDTFLQLPRTELIDARFLSASRSARISFARQGTEDSIDFRFDDLAISGTRPTGSDPESFAVVRGNIGGEALFLGPLTPRFVSQKGGSAEVTLVTYRSAQAARIVDPKVGTAQRQLFAVIGNPATEFGRIPRSKEYEIGGIFTGGLIIGGSFILSSDYNTGIFGVLTLTSAGQAGSSGALRVNLVTEGAHDIATNRLSGRMFDRQGGSVIGTFEGAIYGPNRNHVGLVVDVTLPETGQRHIGYASGIGQDRSN